MVEYVWTNEAYQKIVASKERAEAALQVERERCADLIEANREAHEAIETLRADATQWKQAYELAQQSRADAEREHDAAMIEAAGLIQQLRERLHRFDAAFERTAPVDWREHAGIDFGGQDETPLGIALDGAGDEVEL